jgi:hypothetical protein
MDICRYVQVALLGEVPPTLRFIYANLAERTLHFHAVFVDDAPEDHFECASVALTEILASCPLGTTVVEKIERDSRVPWKINGGKDLMFLRYGELDAT